MMPDFEDCIEEMSGCNGVNRYSVYRLDSSGCNGEMIEMENTLEMLDCTEEMSEIMMLNKLIENLMVYKPVTMENIGAIAVNTGVTEANRLAMLENKWVMHSLLHDFVVNTMEMWDCMSVMLDCMKVSMDPMEIEENRLAMLDCNSAMLDCRMDSLECRMVTKENRMEIEENILMWENIWVMEHLLNIRVMMENILDSMENNRVMMENKMDLLDCRRAMTANTMDSMENISVMFDSFDLSSKKIFLLDFVMNRSVTWVNKIDWVNMMEMSDCRMDSLVNRRVMLILVVHHSENNSDLSDCNGVIWQHESKLNRKVMSANNWVNLVDKDDWVIEDRNVVVMLLVMISNDKVM